MTPLAWGITTALASASCETAGQTGGTSPLVTIALAAIPALGGVAAAWVATVGHHPNRRRR